MKSRKPQDAKKSWRVEFDALGSKSITLLFLISFFLSAAFPAFCGENCAPAGKRGLDVMQVNLYVGTGIDRVVALDPTDPGYVINLITTVTGIFYEAVASQPSVRLQGVADQIAERMPDLVSVEEGSLFRLQSPGDLIYGGSTPATNVVFDYLQILTNALAVRGVHYSVVAVSYNFDAEMPMFNMQTGTIDDVRLTDRTAILARTDLPPGQFRVSNPQGGNFNHVVVTSAGLPLLYGWCAVDVFTRGENIRYVCAHLNQETAPEIQALQAQELLTGPANVRAPVLIVGDFNSDSLGRDGSFAYHLFGDAGFHDAWATLHQYNPAGGLTWGHDEFLADPNVAFDRRIDLVFYKGADLIPTDADVVDMALGRTTPPLWASDHAAVTGEFLLNRGPVSREAEFADDHHRR
jgi:endonuclease/exonuclease/phosphatase family metal-dependent hydrolase